MASSDGGNDTGPDRVKYQEKFRSLWRALETHTRTAAEFDSTVLSVFEELASLKCSCIMAAPALFAGALSQPRLVPPNTAKYKPKGRAALIHYVHNLVNLKLGKPIYKDLASVLKENNSSTQQNEPATAIRPRPVPILDRGEATF